MKADRHTELLNLDVLALSLLCCLLASVVGVLVLGGEENAQANENTQENSPTWTDLRQQSARLFVQVQEAERSREGIVAKLDYSMLERENHTLKFHISDIERKINLLRKLVVTKNESAKIARELEEKEKPITPEAKKMLGEYKGPYVLIECIEDEAFIYPGKERISMKPSKEQTEKLLNQIIKAGFVAFIVRPDGWYGNSFDKLRALICEKLDQAEKQGEKYVGRSTFPLDAGASITNYLPPEHRS